MCVATTWYRSKERKPYNEQNQGEFEQQAKRDTQRLIALYKALEDIISNIAGDLFSVKQLSYEDRLQEGRLTKLEARRDRGDERFF